MYICFKWMVEKFSAQPTRNDLELSSLHAILHHIVKILAVCFSLYANAIGISMNLTPLLSAMGK